MLSLHEYSWVTVDPDTLKDLPNVDSTPLPLLVEPIDQPRVLQSSEEPLVLVQHPFVKTKEVYHHVGWDAAIPVTVLRQGTAERLYSAAEALPEGFGLLVMDAWRPLALQEEIYHAYYEHPDLPPGFVSLPSSDPATPPPHLTGGTVDVTLTWNGQGLSLGTQFDDFTPAARSDFFEPTPGVVRDLRRLLFWVMKEAGFVVLDCEWWHFEYGTRRWAAITGNEPVYDGAKP